VVLIEQRPQREFGQPRRSLRRAGRCVESQRVADDSVHAVLTGALTGEGGFNRATEDDTWATTPSPRVLAWVIKPRTISPPPAPVIGTDDSPVPAMSKASTRTRSCVASTTQPTCASIFQEDTSTDEHDGGVVGQAERGEQVHRHLGRGVPIGQVQNLTAEIQTEAGGGEQILLELHGVRHTFGFIGQGGELRPSVGQRGLLM